MEFPVSLDIMQGFSHGQLVSIDSHCDLQCISQAPNGHFFPPGRTKVFFNGAGPLGRQKLLPALSGLRGGNLEGRGAMMHELIRQNVKSVHYFSAI